MALKRVRTNLSGLSEAVRLEVQAAHPGAVVHFNASGNVNGEWDADETVTLSVHNGGNPIPPALQSFIFEPLARGSPTV